MWDKVFKNGSIEVCGRQPLKSLKYYELILRYIAFSQQRILSNTLKDNMKGLTR